MTQVSTTRGSKGRRGAIQRMAAATVLALALMASVALMASLPVSAVAEEAQAMKPLKVLGARILVPVPFKHTKAGPDFTEQNASQFIAEFVPEGQSVHGWTEMVSISGYDRQVLGDIAAYQLIDLLSRQISSACPDTFVYEALQWPTIGQLETAAAFMGCRSVQSSPIAGLAAGQSELGLFVVARVDNVFVELHHSRRRDGDISDFDQASDPKVQQAYQQFVAKIRVCNSGQDNGACEQ